MTTMERSTRNPVDAFLDAARSASILSTQAWSDDCVIDATVPNWRFQLTGSREIRQVLSRWFADRASFAELRRQALPDGELVEFLLTWTEHGIPHAAHQVHIITVRDGRIAAQTIFCGGRWPADLLAEMAEAAR
jgi:hypothetical protein